MTPKGSPRKYLTVEIWQAFLKNDWRHMNWKVNAMVGLTVTIVIFLAVIFSIALSRLFGG